MKFRDMSVWYMTVFPLFSEVYKCFPSPFSYIALTRKVMTFDFQSVITHHTGTRTHDRPRVLLFFPPFNLNFLHLRSGT